MHQPDVLGRAMDAWMHFCLYGYMYSVNLCMRGSEVAKRWVSLDDADWRCSCWCISTVLASTYIARLLRCPAGKWRRGFCATVHTCTTDQISFHTLFRLHNLHSLIHDFVYCMVQHCCKQKSSGHTASTHGVRVQGSSKPPHMHVSYTNMMSAGAPHALAQPTLIMHDEQAGQ
jgi:hypothetical protein